jgi:hypothetical protein
MNLFPFFFAKVVARVVVRKAIQDSLRTTEMWKIIYQATHTLAWQMTKRNMMGHVIAG